MKEELAKIDGTILEALPNTMFKVELSDGRTILATLKGILRRRYVRIFPGDRVKVEMTKYDTERGRIILKYRK
ncbi:translation initiation factor IF-1 [Candidatus Woesebacteria bacterium RIFCSPLOWO2_01_FULL_39_61]|uniref:Translation initiation factor IF-1 n=2 Tax=Microgenomates group TaxID=1794810 RepID=A0A0H4T869_9BACT|nr:translation initiation factor 1, translation initiation factor IF-1 [uncultured Microgenomates bacterium Rifle_16ft_4_minimus_37836]OGM28068.1 MAG: translation initiation factor IF-1 [Candidatus Woesebacteria bacterium RIFCSPHIGHO2_01_FULL_39_95]OGM34056.1 MAG: translation initiation factor IF-1 [Candidatus Woesebacteria bacterium RIFCSPHIGHO2_02_FULL_39_13]OGM38314.1 MAG: translation initiation factor IF-1 [Candidatus Woesebacteria bacterium RIFCSPHIGHO2_12_FULL_40_20]OGM67777.1 MAG: transl